MKRKTFAALIVALTMTPSVSNAQSQRSSNAPHVGGFYASTDGSYQSIALPSVGNFGFQGLLPATSVLGGSEQHSPRLDGYGVAGGFGYVFAPGVFAPAWGSNVRLEFGGGYIHANGTSVAASGAATNVNLTALPLTGIAPGIAGCGGSTCSTQSTLTSDYTSWNVHLTGKSDFRVGTVTVTPSIAVLFGHGQTDQQFAQQLYSDGAPYPGGPSLWGYNLNAALNWDDAGAKVGLTTVYDLTQVFSAGLGGTVGVVHRSASMSASSSFLFGSLVPRLSAMQDSQTTASLLANIEASLGVRLASNITARGFVGLNYDSSVPGIAAPQSQAFTVSGYPAHIKFDPTTSYYAGGKLTVNFAP